MSDSAGIQTQDLRNRNPMLYSAKLRSPQKRGKRASGVFRREDNDFFLNFSAILSFCRS